MSKKKKIIIGTICAYVGLGLVAAVIFFSDSDILGTAEVNYIASDEIIGGEKVDMTTGKTTSSLEEELEKKEQEAAPEAETRSESETVAEEDMDMEEEAGEKKFYSFKVATKGGLLRIRDNPDLNGATVGRMQNGEGGYVLEKGETWSRIKYKNITGYSSNEFLVMEEIQRDELPADYPEEYK